jgi:U32 family peptidase
MIELLAPAGDLEKLKVAYLYGADAVFIGGNRFSLRARASNFTIDTIKEATRYAHQFRKKLYVTVNIIPHEHDFEGLIDYLKALEEASVDAIIVASYGIMKLALTHTNLEVHLSTQQSTINEDAMKFWVSKGIKRVVLGRELSLNEIEDLKVQSNVDLEVFVHGGMCMSYSGRCSLSDNLTGRDANRGGCAHSCRWEYDLKEDGNQVHDHAFTMSSKDLAAIEHIPKLIDLGIKSLKIEGRMKSLHYVATVVKIYRDIIDRYLNEGQIHDFSPYYDILWDAENRPTSDGYLEGLPTEEGQLFDDDETKPIQSFIAIVKDYDEQSGLTLIEQRNHFTSHIEIDILKPQGDVETVHLGQLMDEQFEHIDVARHPKQLMWVKLPMKLSPYTLIRKHHL